MPPQRAGADACGEPGCTRGDPMKVLRRSWRLAWLAGCTALMAGMAGVAAGPAQAQATGVIFQSHVVASWGDNVSGELGDGTHVSRSLYRDNNAGNQVVQVS